MFFRKATLWDVPGQGRDAPPVFQADGAHYLHVKAGGLFWVATTRENVSPSLVLELLTRMYWVTRDYVGHVSEDAVRKNFLLVYELLDEVLDFGLPQNSSTHRLKQFIAMEPMVVRPRPPRGPATGPSEVVKSVLDTARTGAKDEIFVDVVEKLTAIFDAGGALRASAVVGAVQVKSYLSGNPAIRVGLSENLVLARRAGAGAAAADADAYGAEGAVVLDTYALHEAADAEVFERDHILELVPPEGHFALLTYRSSRPFRPPFRVSPLLEDDPLAADKLTLYVRLRADYDPSQTATGVEVTVPLPPGVQRVHFQPHAAPDASLLAALPGARGAFEQSAEWSERSRRVTWALRNLRGGREHTLRCRLTLDPDALGAGRLEYGPVMLQFVLPGKPSASGLDVKYMKVLKDERGYSPSRWSRVVALANSYQVRTG